MSEIVSENTLLLEEDVRASRAMNVTYGQYRALTYNPAKSQAKEPGTVASQPSKKRKRKYTDQELFDLWKQGKTDAEIGAAVGVSRAMIQKWRDNMELPSGMHCKIDRKKYQLVETPYGLYAVSEDDLK